MVHIAVIFVTLPFIHIDHLVVFKKSLELPELLRLHHTPPVDHPGVPLSRVYIAVDPGHCAVAMSEIVEKLADVTITTLPDVFALPAFFIIGILTLVIDYSIFSFLPNPNSVPNSSRKRAFVIISVSPCVFSDAVWLVALKLAFVIVSVTEFFLAKPILHVFPELSEVDILIVFQDSIAVCLASFPIALINEAINRLKYSLAMSFAIGPFALILIPIGPGIDSEPFLLSVLKIAFINISIVLNFIAFSVFAVVKPIAFVGIACSHNYYPHAVLPLVLGLAIVLVVILDQYSEIGLLE